MIGLSVLASLDMLVRLSPAQCHTQHLQLVKKKFCKSFGRYVLLGFKQQQQDLIYNHLCLRK